MSRGLYIPKGATGPTGATGFSGLASDEMRCYRLLLQMEQDIIDVGEIPTCFSKETLLELSDILHPKG